MRNREYVARQLMEKDFIDDGGSSYEATVFYNIACPYTVGDPRAHCYKKTVTITRKRCYNCKEEWLNNPVEGE
mgnify:FL=1